MTRVKTAAFKMNMGRYLRAVRAGEEIVILDRDRPVARVLAWDMGDHVEPLSIEEPAKNSPPPGSVKITPVRATRSITAMLLRERAQR